MLLSPQMLPSMLYVIVNKQKTHSNTDFFMDFSAKRRDSTSARILDFTIFYLYATTLDQVTINYTSICSF